MNAKDSSRSRPVSKAPVDIFENLRTRTTAWKITELAVLLNLGRRTLYDAIESGQLPAMRLGGSVRINPFDVVAWVDARTTGVSRQAA